jgi:hypothetical protein
MKLVRIVLEAEIPEGMSEGSVDVALSDTIADLGGKILNSSEFQPLEAKDVSNI